MQIRFPAGLSLHAGVSTEAHQRDKLERPGGARLCRYATRPAVSEKRLALTFNGNICYQLKTRYRDGTTHVVLDRGGPPSLDFVAQLAALVPKPPREFDTLSQGVPSGRPSSPSQTGAAPAELISIRFTSISAKPEAGMRSGPAVAGPAGDETNTSASGNYGTRYPTIDAFSSVYRAAKKIMNQSSQAAVRPPESAYVTAGNCFGQQLKVLPDDTIGSALLKHGLYDRKGVCMMNAVLRQLRNPIVLDIGANIGNHSLAMSTEAKQIYSFEPQSAIYQVLSANISANNIDNITALNMGLSSRDQQMELYIPASDNNGAATLRKELKSDAAITETIQLRKGDDVIKGLHLSHLDMIKLDVEGFEIEVLVGLDDTIARFQPIIFMEWDQDITRQEAAKSPLFERLLRDYQPMYIGSNYDRDQWPDSILGKLQRGAYKLCHRRQWLLRPADLQQNYSNLVLLPAHRLDLPDAIGLVSLD